MSNVERYLVWDEWYPVYSLVDDRGEYRVEISEEVAERYDRAMRAFQEIQDELAALAQEQRARRGRAGR